MQDCPGTCSTHAWQVPSARSRQDYLFSPEVRLTAPYLDSFGRGFLISELAQIIAPSGEPLAIAGVDMLASDVRKVILDLRNGDGESHLFHVGSRTVVGSQQYVPDPMSAPPEISELLLPMSNLSVAELQAAALRCAPGGSGLCNTTPFMPLFLDTLAQPRNNGTGILYGRANSTHANTVDVDDYLVAWRLVLGGEYCIVAFTPGNQVRRPIDDQLSAIEAGSAAVIKIVLIAAFLAMGVIIFASCCTAWQVSRPVRLVMANSQQMAVNIGKDITDGVNLDKNPYFSVDVKEQIVLTKASGFMLVCRRLWTAAKALGSALHGLYIDDPGEVGAMEAEFAGLLQRLVCKQQLASRRPPANPLFQSVSLTTTLNENVPMEKVETEEVAAEEVMTPPPSPPEEMAAEGVATEGVARAEVAIEVEAPPLPAFATNIQTSLVANKALGQSLMGQGEQQMPRIKPRHFVEEDIAHAGIGKSQLKRWNLMRRQMIARVVIPIMLSVVVVIILDAVQVLSNLGTWASHLKDGMVQNELASIERQNVAQAEFLTAKFETVSCGSNSWFGAKSLWIVARSGADNATLDLSPAACSTGRPSPP